MKIVIDTNGLISGIFWEGNESKILKACKIGNLTNYISPDTIKEFERVLSYKKFKFTLAEIRSALETVLSFSIVVIPHIKLDVIKDDPLDDIFLECALTANVEYIISGDKHLLDLGEYKGIMIMNGARFLREYKEIIG